MIQKPTHILTITDREIRNVGVRPRCFSVLTPDVWGSSILPSLYLCLPVAGKSVGVFSAARVEIVHEVVWHVFIVLDDRRHSDRRHGGRLWLPACVILLPIATCDRGCRLLRWGVVPTC